MAVLHRSWTASMTMSSLLLLLLLLLRSAAACNDAICASIVSKCQVMESCMCEITPDKPCTCCERCQRCLDYLYHECCSCVGLCPRPNATELAAIQESVVFDFSEEAGEVVPSLWESLTSAGNSDPRWDAFTYPVDIHPAQVKGSAAMTAKLAPTASTSSSESVLDAMMLGSDTPTSSSAHAQLVTANCTVAFLTERMAKHKCKSNCVSMGAAAGRWFADACCECVGHNCQNYGVAQSRCPIDDEEEDDLGSLTDEQLDEMFRKEQDRLVQQNQRLEEGEEGDT